MTTVQTRIAAAIMVMLCGAASAVASPLQRYVDRSRVLVIAAPTAMDEKRRRQTEMLSGPVVASLLDRDIVLIQAVGSGLQAKAIRQAIRLPPDRFGVALLGKDGGVKLRSDAPITAQTLFSVIDAMPMRKAEVRARRPARP